MSKIKAIQEEATRQIRLMLADTSIPLEDRFNDMMENGSPSISPWYHFDYLPFPELQTIPDLNVWATEDMEKNAIAHFDGVLDGIENEQDRITFMQWCVDNYVGGVTNDW
jgi:hypothetical protein